ncbi:MAG: hypothetical protein IPM82_22235 [Saprospiraceae bacterium]|nr:hypothetical protein [Saprospiraceae bacterium]
MRILQHRTFLATIALGLFLFVANASALSFAEKSIIRLKASVNLKLNLLGIERGLLVLPPSPPTTVSVRVNVGSDDAEQNLSTGAVTVNSNDLELVVDVSASQLIGMRFNGMAIPAGAIITNAYIEFETDAVWSNACNLTIQRQAADNPTTFTTAANNLSTRTKTTASVAWSPAAWNTIDEKQQTPDLKAILQEIVNRPGWASGNSIAMLIQGTGTREAESYEGEATAAPLLVIQYALVESCGNGIDDDADGLIDGADPDCGSYCPTGGLSLERWTGIGSGNAVSDLTSNSNYPNYPSETGVLTSFDGPDNYADNYGTRVRGFIRPSQTGIYTFNLTSDDGSELYLSTDASSVNKVLISSVSGYTGTTEYSKYASQTSSNIALVAGQNYYVELLQKEGGGADHFQVYWKTPSNASWTIIPGGNLCPITCSENCGNGTDDDGDGLIDAADRDCSTFCATGNLSLERWLGIAGTNVSNLTSNANYPNSPYGNKHPDQF